MYGLVRVRLSFTGMVLTWHNMDRIYQILQSIDTITVSQRYSERGTALLVMKTQWHEPFNGDPHNGLEVFFDV
jgi:hypothetical protein